MDDSTLQIRVVPQPRNFGPKPRVSWSANARLMRLLWDGPHTLAELMEETGLAASTVRGYVKALRNQRLVAIVDLLPAHNGNKCIHVYQWKPDSKDVKRRRQTQAERQRGYRERRAAMKHAATLCFLVPAPDRPDPLPY